MHDYRCKDFALVLEQCWRTGFYMRWQLSRIDVDVLAECAQSQEEGLASDGMDVRSYP